MHFFIELDDVDTTQKRMVEASYMVGAILFILSLSGLSAETTSRKGNFHGICGMTLAIISTFFLREFHNEYMVFSIAFIVGGLIGLALAMYVQMIQMPQMVACLHSFVGIAATVVAFSNYFLERYAMPSLLRDIETYIGIFIGAITFSGSVIAFMKLAGLGGRAFEGPLTIFGSFRHALNVIVLLSVLIFGVFFCMYDLVDVFLYLNCGLSLLLGIHMVRILIL
jgi:H+-translocating NAD(P) transhydrogenase subunit beta